MAHPASVVARRVNLPYSAYQSDPEGFKLIVRTELAAALLVDAADQIQVTAVDSAGDAQCLVHFSMLLGSEFTASPLGITDDASLNAAVEGQVRAQWPFAHLCSPRFCVAACVERQSPQPRLALVLERRRRPQRRLSSHLSLSVGACRVGGRGLGHPSCLILMLRRFRSAYVRFSQYSSIQ